MCFKAVKICLRSIFKLEKLKSIPESGPNLKPSRTLRGPSWAQKPFHVPFLARRKQASISLLDFPSVPNGRFKQLLIREQRWCRDTGGAVKEQQCSLGAGSWCLLKENTQQYLWGPLQELRPPSRWGMPTPGWAQDCWSPALLPHHQPTRRKSHNPKFCL